MGGCKCTFRSCKNTSALVPGLHFFHYPVKYPARLQHWLENAHTQALASLPMASLKNKVVCQNHFKPECFMNYKQDSLTKTAVPTEWNDQCSTPDSEDTEPPCKVYIPDPIKYIRVGSEEEKRQEMARNNSTVRIITQCLRVHDDKEEEEVPQQRRQHSEQELTAKLQEYSKHLEEQKDILLSQQNQMEDIKNVLQDLSKARMTPNEDPPKPSSSATNKRNLFHALKRHINPVMATLLGMELFGSPDHEWRDDEKDLAMELHSQGESVYKFFRDDLRFRLPAIADVENWKKTVND